MRTGLFVRRFSRRPGVLRAVHLRFHRRRLGAGGRARLRAALLGACAAVDAVDPADHAWAVAAGEGAADLAAVSPPGGRGASHAGRRPVNARRGGLALPVLFALTAFLVFIGLGTWQLDRKAWKEELIATLTLRSSTEPADLPDASRWPAMNQTDDEFRRVKFRAEFLPAREALVYSSGSALRPDVKAPGYFVFAPARTEKGAIVVINRGFSPDARARAPDSPKPPGMIEMVGALRWPERAGWFVREHDEAEDTWFARNHVAMAARNEWGFAGPFYVELESPI